MIEISNVSQSDLADIRKAYGKPGKFKTLRQVADRLEVLGALNPRREPPAAEWTEMEAAKALGLGVPVGLSADPAQWPTPKRTRAEQLAEEVSAVRAELAKAEQARHVPPAAFIRTRLAQLEADLEQETTRPQKYAAALDQVPKKQLDQWRGELEAAAAERAHALGDLERAARRLLDAADDANRTVRRVGSEMAAANLSLLAGEHCEIGVSRRLDAVIVDGRSWGLWEGPDLLAAAAHQACERQTRTHPHVVGTLASLAYRVTGARRRDNPFTNR
jgi:hypothetical protein